MISRVKVFSRIPYGGPVWVARALYDMSECHRIEDELRTSEINLNRAGRMVGVGS